MDPVLRERLNDNCGFCCSPLLDPDSYGFFFRRKIAVLPCKHPFHKNCFQFFASNMLEKNYQIEGTLNCWICQKKFKAIHSGKLAQKWSQEIMSISKLTLSTMAFASLSIGTGLTISGYSPSFFLMSISPFLSSFYLRFNEHLLKQCVVRRIIPLISVAQGFDRITMADLEKVEPLDWEAYLTQKYDFFNSDIKCKVHVNKDEFILKSRIFIKDKFPKYEVLIGKMGFILSDLERAENIFLKINLIFLASGLIKLLNFEKNLKNNMGDGFNELLNRESFPFYQKEEELILFFQSSLIYYLFEENDTQNENENNWPDEFVIKHFLFKADYQIPSNNYDSILEIIINKMVAESMINKDH